jgi:phosphoglycolate phosphatase-like HAD superfamily hydrolase
VRPLILFDIDATLLKTDGAGMSAMADAGRELFGPAFPSDGIDFAGRLDPLIFRELFALNGVGRTSEAEQRFRTVYYGHLTRRLATSTTARALPGAAALVQALRDAQSHELGILTGNFRESGSLKLQACGLNPSWFPSSAWGDDSPHDPPARDHLPPVAMSRYEAHTGVRVNPAHVTIIGDTPHDVQCALVNGCRCIAVATGRFSEAALTAAGATLVVPHLANTGRMLDLLVSASASSPT